MSTISSAILPRDSVGERLPRTIGAALKGWWIAYVNWRMERLAVSRLHVHERPRTQGHGRIPRTDRVRSQRRDCAAPDVQPLLLKITGPKRRNSHERQYGLPPAAGAPRAGDSPALLGRWRQPVVLPGRGAGRPLRGAGAGALRLREHGAMDRRARLHARRRGRASHRADRQERRQGSPRRTLLRRRRRAQRGAGPAGPHRQHGALRAVGVSSAAPDGRARRGSPSPRSPASPGTSARASSPATIGERLPAFVDYWNGPGSWNALRPARAERADPLGAQGTARLPRADRRSDAGRRLSRADVSRADPARRACARRRPA